MLSETKWTTLAWLGPRRTELTVLAAATLMCPLSYVISPSRMGEEGGREGGGGHLLNTHPPETALKKPERKEKGRKTRGGQREASFGINKQDENQ